MNTFRLLLLFVLALVCTTATAQDRVLVGVTRNGGVVFQTLIHRGRSSLQSKMSADGPGSRTESHARFDDGDDSSAAPAQRLPTNLPRATEPEPQPAVEQPVQQPAASTKEAQPVSGPAEDADGGGHLICILKADGSWKAYGLTPDQAKAQHTVQVLRLQKIEARVFQYLPLHVEAAGLLPIDNAVGLAVRISGEVYAVAKNGRLVEVLMPSAADSE